MRIRITRSGIFRTPNEQIPVGTEIDVPDDFRGWANKWIRVDSPKATLEVASPAPTEETEEDPLTEDERQDIDLAELRHEFEAAFGHAPHHKMKADTIRRKLAETEAE